MLGLLWLQLYIQDYGDNYNHLSFVDCRAQLFPRSLLPERWRHTTLIITVILSMNRQCHLTKNTVFSLSRLSSGTWPTSTLGSRSEQTPRLLEVPLPLRPHPSWVANHISLHWVLADELYLVRRTPAIHFKAVRTKLSDLLHMTQFLAVVALWPWSSQGPITGIAPPV